MELPLLQHPADMLIVVRGPGIRTRVRMAPRTRKIRAILRLQEGDQGHLAHCRDPSQSRGAADRGSTCMRLRRSIARHLGELKEGKPNLSRVGMLSLAYASWQLGTQWLRNRNARLAKPLDDGVVQVAADRQGLFHIGNNATQLEFQRAVPEAQPEAQQECPGGR